MAYKGPNEAVGPGSSTDNALVRWDNTTGFLIQDSSAILSDSDALSGLTQLDVDNIRVDGNTISSTDTNGDLTLSPDGTGNIEVSNGNVNLGEGSLTVDPGASGDSFVQFDINTTNEYRLGVDDDDSDKFKLSQGNALGTNDTFVMTSGGTRTLPLQPCFRARNNSVISNVTGDSTNYTVIFNTEVFDIGSNYDISTGLFTAPVDGIYLFCANVLFSGITSSHTGGIIQFNPSSGIVNRFFEGSPAAIRAGSLMALGGSAIYQLSASDTMSIQLRFSNGSKVVDINTNSIFEGYLLG